MQTNTRGARMDRISEIQRKLDFCIQKTESLNLTSILDRVSRDNLKIDGSSKPRAFAQPVTAVAEVKRDDIVWRIETGFKRRSGQYKRTMLEEWRNSSKGNSTGIDVSLILSVLKNYNINLGSEEESSLRLAIQESGDTDFSQIGPIVERMVSDYSAFRWSKSIPLHELLADAIPWSHDKEEQNLKRLGDLTEREIRIISECVGDGLAKLLTQEVQNLKDLSTSNQYAKFDSHEAGHEQSTIEAFATSKESKCHPLKTPDVAKFECYPLDMRIEDDSQLPVPASEIKKMHLAHFQARIWKIRSGLQLLAKESDAEARLKGDRTAGQRTVESFIARIMEQCVEVMKRHQELSSDQYVHDGIFSSLVSEMTSIEMFARSKFEEWLKNTEYSFISFRMNANLTTAFRRYVAWLERRLETIKPADERQIAALEICSLRRLIFASIDEKNDLDETRLISAAAEGRSPAELSYLVEAGIEVNGVRPDGVSAIWVAAQFGHTESIRKLAALGANVNLAANNGATPVYTAAQSGHSSCIKLLASLNADVTKADNNGSTPLHQAAMNGHDDCLLTLSRLGGDVLVKSSDSKTPLDVASTEKCRFRIGEIMKTCSKVGPSDNGRPLIITTGDISDVDGFFALAEYAKTDSDVLFIMNYPAYIGVEDDQQEVLLGPGMGYKFGPKVVMEAVKESVYLQFMARYDDLTSCQEKMKSAMTDVAFYICQRVWQDRPAGAKGDCYFCIGGVNSINPFSAKAIKNEVSEYCHLIPAKQHRLPVVEGVVLDLDSHPRRLDYSRYSDIFMDFNGSMSFLNEAWFDRLRQPPFSEKLRAVFVMGGVYADAAPLTLPSIPGSLNRFSSATMNQLYHPEKAADFFTFLSECAERVTVYTITNNVIHDLAEGPKEKEAKTYKGVEQFMAANGLDMKSISDIAHAHYTSTYNPPRKEYDFYVAKALVAVLSASRGCPGEVEKKKLTDLAIPYAFKRLFYCRTHGVTVVGGSNSSWEGALFSFKSKIDVDPKADDAEFIRTKKENFQKEISAMENWTSLPYLAVRDLTFDLDPETKLLTIIPAA